MKYLENVGFVLLFGMVCMWGIYSLLCGRNRRLIWSREHIYRNICIDPISDDQFCSHKLFQENCIPREYVLAKRWEIGDYYLDFPPEYLNPEMKCEDIPFEPSIYEDIDGLTHYLKGMGVDPEKLICNNTVAQLIVNMYNVEKGIIWFRDSYIPFWWRKELKKIEKNTKLPLQDVSLNGISVADLVVKLWNIRSIDN